MSKWKILFGKKESNNSVNNSAANSAQPESASASTSSANANASSDEPKTDKEDVKGKQDEKESTPQESAGEDNKVNGKAHIYNLIIVDESGSMHHLRRTTVSGINETINTIKSAQKKYSETQTHTLTLVTFDSGNPKGDIRTIIDNKPIAEVGEFSDYEPNGCTPLYDAMGQSITNLYNLIKDDGDATGVVTVMTDGLENASREWRASALRELINKLKEEGWTFSYMGSAHDVKSVTDLLSIDNVMEFSHDDLGATSTWDREISSRMNLYGNYQRIYKFSSNVSHEEKKMMKRQLSKGYYDGRVAPDFITHLEPNEIFVFGSNVNGHHAGGAARQAERQFGAIWGQGEGLQGQSYAIPTMEGMENLRAAVERFIQFAANHPEMKFLVTRIGCGIAGYSVEEIAPLFKSCIKLPNVALPEDFWEILGLKMF